jgi:hypothetical protein
MPTREVKYSHHAFLRMLTVQGILSLEEGHVLLSSFNVFKLYVHYYSELPREFQTFSRNLLPIFKKV